MERTVELLDGTRKRVNLPDPHWGGRREIGAGLFLQSLYSGPKSGRRFCRTYSQWSRPDGQTCWGEQVREVDESEYLRLCDLVGAEPVTGALQEV
jgi:hypothetical protein